MSWKFSKLMSPMSLIALLAFLSILSIAFISGTGSAASKGSADGKGVSSTPVADKSQASVPQAVGTVVPISEGFELGFGSFVYEYYGCDGTSCPWSLVTDASHSGTHSAFAPDVNVVGDTRLELQPAELAIPTNATSATLSFYHKYGFEANSTYNYDGGVLEVTLDNGNTWNDAGANITSGGYGGSIVSGSSNPLTGRMAWVGDHTASFTQVQVNLMPYRGSSFRFRLRLGTDVSNGGAGWWVDDVVVSYTANLASCGQAWSTVSNYPISVSSPAVASLGGLIYSFGGKISDGTPTTASYSYNPSSNSWTPIAALPGTRVGAGAVTDGTYIYVFGGVDDGQIVSGVMWRYDPSTNSYTTLAPFHTATVYHGAAYLNGVIYRISGLSDWWQSSRTNTVEAYTIATNSWAYVADYPNAVTGMGAISLNGYIYAAGGVSDLTNIKKAYRFDPANNTWDDGPIADLPGSVVFMASALYNGRWLLAPASPDSDQTAFAWNPGTNIWSSIDQLPIITGQTGGAVAGGAFYVVAGYGLPGVMNTVQKYVETQCIGPSPTATPNTPVPTNTPTNPVPTNTPNTPVPTNTPGGVCVIQFSDVPEGSTFYTFVRCLACRGIIGGYSDGTFRPSNNVTRGQIAKIVSNAAGFEDTQTNQMFEDVPMGSTFFDFAGRLASRGIMGGYPCGGAGEPCGGGSLPYFRSNNNASRGQIAKIVSNAAGFNDTQTNQIFQDVAAGSTFFDFVGRLASRGFIGGYPCGGAGEPCGGGSLPYFRPSSNASRGQSAKIVSNTFFPGCVTP